MTSETPPSSFIDAIFHSDHSNLFSFVTITWITSIGTLTLLLTPILAVFFLIIGLASSGSSFGIRKMYVKALLKIFEYATNIKDEKVKDCEELIDSTTTPDEVKRRKKLAKLRRLRYESFVLHPPEKTKNKLNNKSDGSDTNSSSLSSTESQEDNDAETEEETSTDKNNNNNNNNNRLSQSGDNNDNLESLPKTPIKTVRTRLNSSSSANKQKRDNDPNKTTEFAVSDVIQFLNQGIEAIIDDNVTKRFTTKELTVWNLLSRTNQQYEYISFRVTLLWALGLILRYFVLFPFRLILFIFACIYTFLSSMIIGTIPDGRFKRWLNWYQTLILHRILSRVFSAIITFHNRENRARTGSICVANHTSPIDVIILSTDACYAMIGQTHGGFTGMMQKAFSRSANHIWFDRTQTRDRNYVAKRMRQHVSQPDNLPILIFPEGTCINNTSVMMFKKGCFEVDTTIFPVAIKYDLRFGDAFWNSGQHTMLQYLLLMMTSWAIVVDVYYLPPMCKKEGEDAAHFASRVKAEIVKKGSFVDLHWDGMLKRVAPKLDLMYQQQLKYVKQLKID